MFKILKKRNVLPISAIPFLNHNRKLNRKHFLMLFVGQIDKMLCDDIQN